MKRRVFCIILSILFVLSACGAETSEMIAAEKHRDELPPQARLGFCFDEEKLSNNVSRWHGFARYGQRFAYCEMSDPGAYRDVETGEMLSRAPAELRLQSADVLEGGLGAFDQEGNAYWAVYVEGEGMTVRVSYLDGRPNKSLLLDWWDGAVLYNANDNIPVRDYVRVTELRADGRFIYLLTPTVEPQIGFEGDLWVFDLDGNLLRSHKTQCFEIDYKGHYFQSNYVNRAIYKYDSATGAVLDSRLLNVADKEVVMRLCYEYSEDKLYWATYYNVQCAPADEISDSEIIASYPLNMFHLFDPTGIKGLAVTPNGDIYLSGMGTLMKYTYVGPWEVPDHYDVVVTAPFYDPAMEMIIAMYERATKVKHVYYEYTYPSKSAFLQNREADGYYDRETMDLLSGQIGDILILDAEYPYLYDRLNSELFFDLGPYLESDPIRTELSTAMLDAAAVDGAQRAVPLAMDEPVLLVNAEAAARLAPNVDWGEARWSDLLCLWEQASAEGVSLFAARRQTSDDLLLAIIDSNLPDVTRGEVDLHGKDFFDLIERWMVFLNKEELLRISAAALDQRDDWLFCVERSSDDLEELWSLMSNQSGIEVYPVPCGEARSGRCASSDYLCAITQWAEDADEAYRFISFACTWEPLTRLYMEQTPINHRARAYTLSQLSVAEPDEPAFELFVQCLEEIVGSVDYLYRRYDLREIVKTELDRWLNDEITLDQALTNAEDAIWRQINE